MQGGIVIIRNLFRVWTLCAFGLSIPSCFGQLRAVVDHVGYEPESQKIALVAGSEGDPAPVSFALIDASTGKAVSSGKLHEAGTVAHWTGRKFWTADFSDWRKPGHYTLKIQGPAGDVASCEFAIEEDLLERNTLSNVIFYFKGQRASGDMDRADRHLPVPGEAGAFADLHGGWYDATGDYGIHLSHQNPTSYFNPQQVPLVAWTLLSSYRLLEARKNDNFTENERRLLDEGCSAPTF